MKRRATFSNENLEDEEGFQYRKLTIESEIVADKMCLAAQIHHPSCRFAYLNQGFKMGEEMKRVM